MGIVCFKKKSVHGKYVYSISWPMVLYSLTLHIAALSFIDKWRIVTQTVTIFRVLLLRALSTTVVKCDAIRTGPKYDEIVAKLHQMEETLQWEWDAPECTSIFEKLAPVPSCCRAAFVTCIFLFAQSRYTLIVELYIGTVQTLIYWRIFRIFAKFLAILRKLNASLTKPQFLGLNLKQKCVFRVNMEALFVEFTNAIDCALVTTICNVYLLTFATTYTISDILGTGSGSTIFAMKFFLIAEATVKLFVIPGVCTNLTNEFSRTWEIVKSLDDNTPAAREMKSRLMGISSARQVLVAPYSLFVMNKSIVFLVLTSSFKYAIVVMQLGNM